MTKRHPTSQRDASTFAAFAQAEADIVGGRYGAISKSTVTGSSPTVNYPELPQNSPWHHDDVPPEPPISFPEITAIEPVDTHQEIAASLGDAHSGDVGHSSPHAADSAPPGDEQHLDAGAPSRADGAPSPPSRKRRKR